MKALFHLTSLLALLGSLHAQSLTPEVVASAGASFRSATLSLEWTLGEPSTESYTDGLLLTQGFHQPSLGVATSVVRPEAAGSVPISVFPNPATSEVYVLPPTGAEILGLYDAAGRRLPVPFGGSGDRQRADVAALARGIYFLRIRLGDGQFTARPLVVR